MLAIVSEVYFRETRPRPDLAEGRRRLDAKIAQINAVPDPAFRIADYGTRRRFSRDWQDEVVRTLKEGIGAKFVGTSNVKLAFDHSLTPLGTMAHEYLQACQAVGPRLRDSQVFAFNTWAREYRGDLGIALSDVCGMDAFLRDFDLFFCKLFDGVRHDSGDPFEWGEKLIAHYQKMRIDPRTKVMVFSDSLNVPLAIRLFEYFKGRSQTAFGIGTNLTNDLGYDPLQIVIKMTRCNGQPVAKISDEPSKAMDYDPSYVAYLREVFEVPETVGDRRRRRARRRLAAVVERVSVRSQHVGAGAHEHDCVRSASSRSKARTVATAIGTACVERIAVRAAADRRERDRRESVADGELERAPVARGQQLRLAAAAAVPDRSDRVDDVPRRAGDSRG